MPMYNQEYKTIESTFRGLFTIMEQNHGWYAYGAIRGFVLNGPFIHASMRI